MTAPRITGPLRTWYDLHEALAHEVTDLAAAASTLGPDEVPAFTERFSFFASELRVHSEVEDGIMFPAIAARGGAIGHGLGDEHHREQQAVYDTGCALLEISALGTDRLPDVAAGLVTLRDGLLEHLADEEQHVLPLVPELFDGDEQAHLLRTIIGSMPADARLQAWVAASLTPDHREARLRNMAASLPTAVLASVLTEIRVGVTPEVWADIRDRLPDLAAMGDPLHPS